MPLKPHPTDPDKMVYASRWYDIPQLQGVTTAQPAQEFVAYLCGPDENGLFGLPTPDKACKNCFPVYRKLPQPAQEPLEYWNAVEGWVKVDEVREHFASVGCGTIYKTAGEDRVPVYTTPPQRPWVGLTAENFSAINQSCFTKLQAATSAESILKEKNF